MRAWRTAYGAKKYRALFKHPSFWAVFVKARAGMWLTKRYFSRSDGTAWSVSMTGGFAEWKQTVKYDRSIFCGVASVAGHFRHRNK